MLLLIPELVIRIFNAWYYISSVHLTQWQALNLTQTLAVTHARKNSDQDMNLRYRYYNSTHLTQQPPSIVKATMGSPNFSQLDPDVWA